MPTQAKENYLKAIYFLDRQHSRINITELSKKMGVSKPTVNNMIKKLQEKGWVIYQKYKPIQLTEKGKKEAALIIRKHRLAEMFLQEIMDFGWEQVHPIAEEMEHIQSQQFFDRMDEMLDYPTIDPHGSPIPDSTGQVVEQQYLNLTTIDAGQTVRLCAVGSGSNELLHYLNQRQIKLGTEITIIRIEDFDNSLVIRCDQREPIMISQKVGKHLLVELI